MKKTKIICTMGPSTDDVGLLAQMMRSGMDLARFNFSHGSHDDHARRVELVRRAAAEVEKPIALIADTKGPEMRLGIFKAGKVILKEGDSFTLTTEEIEGTEEISYVNYAGLPEELQPGNAILLSDGLLALEVTSVDVAGFYRSRTSATSLLPHSLAWIMWLRPLCKRRTTCWRSAAFWSSAARRWASSPKLKTMPV